MIEIDLPLQVHSISGINVNPSVRKKLNNFLNPLSKRNLQFILSVAIAKQNYFYDRVLGFDLRPCIKINIISGRHENVCRTGTFTAENL